MSDKLHFLDRIYEAAVIPERWRDVCNVLAERSGAFSSSLFSIGEDNTYRWISTANVEALFLEFSVSEDRHDNIRPRRALSQAPGIFVRDSDILTPEEIRNDAVLQNHVYPRGLKWTVGCVIQEPSGHQLVFDLMRKAGDAPFSNADMAQLNALKPDLARAAFLTSRLAFQQVQTYAAAMESVGLPAAVIGDNGRVLALNAALEALAPAISTGAANTLHVENPAARALIDQALVRLSAGAAPAVQSIPIPASATTVAMIVHVIPVRRDARDVFSRSLAVLIASPVGQVGPPAMRVLCGLFDLTPAEARLAREIAVGAPLNDVARRLGISIETVRTQLKRVMAKTGTRRQSELAALLSGLSPLVRQAGDH